MRVILLLARGLRTSAGSGVLCAASTRSFPVISRPHPKTSEEYHQLARTPELREGNIVRVAVVGEPNVGKSTIINKLIASDVCPVSKKAHTTRSANRAALTSGNLQMLLVDTPGAVGRVHARKHHLPEGMVTAPVKAIENRIDVLAVVVDASDTWRRDFLSLEVSQLLQEHKDRHPGGCSILILNKVDRLKSKRQLLACIESLCEGIVDNKVIASKKMTSGRRSVADVKEQIWQKEERRQKLMTLDVPNRDKLQPPDPGTYKPEYPPRYASWPYFSRVFMVSATQNDGIDDLRSFLKERSNSGVWEYRPDFVYSQKPQELAQDILRERLLDNLTDEIPYEVRPRVVLWNLDEAAGVLHVSMAIECKNDRQARAVLGPGGRTTTRISQQLRQRLCNVFQCEVALKLAVNNKKKSPPKEEQAKPAEAAKPPPETLPFEPDPEKPEQ